MPADERPTKDLLDEYDESIREVTGDQAKQHIATVLRRQAGDKFVTGDDDAAHALRDFAIQIETTLLSEQDYGAHIETINIIYQVISERQDDE